MLDSVNEELTTCQGEQLGSWLAPQIIAGGESVIQHLMGKRYDDLLKICKRRRHFGPDQPISNWLEAAQYERAWAGIVEVWVNGHGATRTTPPTYDELVELITETFSRYR